MSELQPEVLIAAYCSGYFPMDVEGELGWFSPDPRAIIPLDAFHASHTLRQLYRSRRFEVRLNSAFSDVIRGCADRPNGTWISPEIIAAYERLHRCGVAHSVETWQDGILAGGLYGVALGGAFFGESMFHRVRDASKIALLALVERLQARGFRLLDTQWMTDHLRRFGAVEIPREQYLRKLRRALAVKTAFVDPVSGGVAQRAKLEGSSEPSP